MTLVSPVLAQKDMILKMIPSVNPKKDPKQVVLPLLALVQQHLTKRAAKKASVQAHLLIASVTIGAAIVEIAALTSTTLALKVGLGFLGTSQ
jgi:hypothetical protein